MKIISKEKIIDSVVVLIVMLNTILTMLGWNPIPYSEEEIYVGISSLATVISTVYIWWKNNNLKNKVVEAETKAKEMEQRAILAENKVLDLKTTIANLGEIATNGNKA